MKKIQQLQMMSGSPKWITTLYDSLATARKNNPDVLPNFFRIKK